MGGTSTFHRVFTPFQGSLSLLHQTQSVALGYRISAFQAAGRWVSQARLITNENIKPQQRAMSKRGITIFAYIALLALSLPIPLLHHYHTDRVIETMRPVIKLADGSWAPMLMPMHILLVRWLGDLSWGISYSVVALFLLSFWREIFGRSATICAVAICQCAFTTFYAFYSTFIFGTQWLEWTQRQHEATESHALQRTGLVSHTR